MLNNDELWEFYSEVVGKSSEDINRLKTTHVLLERDSAKLVGYTIDNEFTDDNGTTWLVAKDAHSGEDSKF